MVTDPLPQLTEDYVKLVTSTILTPFKEMNRLSELVFTYTAMHGVGYRFVRTVLDAINVRMVAVEEQKDPDPDFSTVK